MSDIPEAIGGLAEGALLGRAVEPKHGEADKGHFHETACLNCSAPLEGPYCKQCGQRGHVHRTIGAFFHDLLHGVLHFEGKTWRTLPLLAFKPGKLTRDYIDGKRASFVSPMALFLFSVFLMFAVFQVMGISPPSTFNSAAVFNDNAFSDVAQLEGRLAGVRTARENVGDGNPAAPVLDQQITEIEAELKTARAAEEAAKAEAAAEPSSVAASASATAAATAGGKEVLVSDARGLRQLTTRRTGWDFLDHGIDKWRENPGLMAYKMQANSYKYSWLLIPLSIPFVWLLFAWRRQFAAYDHAVFVTYSLAFMTLLLITLALVGQVPGTGTVLFFGTTLIPPLHIYKQLRGAYGLSRFSALWRTGVLLVFVVIILLLFLNLLLVLGALG